MTTITRYITMCAVIAVCFMPGCEDSDSEDHDHDHIEFRGGIKLPISKIGLPPTPPPPVDPDPAGNDAAIEATYTKCDDSCETCVNLFKTKTPNTPGTYHNLCSMNCKPGVEGQCPESDTYASICVPYFPAGACAIDCSVSPCPGKSTCRPWVGGKHICMWLQ